VGYVLTFLRAAHERDLRHTVRDGVNLVRYAMKLLRRGEAAGARQAVDAAMRLALTAEELEEFEIR
jgi:hypothetical protein